MKKNRKGFTLMELSIVVLILSVLAAISIPQYRTATKKAKVAANLPILKTLQDDTINFYNLNGTLPTSLFQLSLNRAEFSGTDTHAIDTASKCSFTLSPLNQDFVTIDCSQGWIVTFQVNVNNGRITPGPRLFKVINGDDLLRKVADSFGWQSGWQGQSHFYTIS
ncbi:MAG: prepilin-type N-terminal cleavage/methylation domain-containing protein [Elusimicrobiaceae bacterium]|nr:prepilin-type N-terminal cleavage/methylation domain-containing protein [Elusimicrobiaceae bacterium]